MNLYRLAFFTSLCRRGVLISLLSIAAGLSSVRAQVGGTAYTFSHLAGATGTGGIVDGARTDARFLRPAGVVADRFGTVYVADTLSGTIRKISPTGTVTTLAGSDGKIGFTDGSGAAARFDGPSALAVDSFGTVYVADTNNNRIRKITSSGVVTTLAGSGQAGSSDGTNGSSAQFFHPSGLTLDGAGNVYVTDTFNHTIRKITALGTVTTLAGTPGVQGSADGAGTTATFSFPTGITIASNGLLYVTDSQNGTIRTVTSAGVVGTFAGTAGRTGTADGMGSSAQFSYPTGIGWDTDGSLYVVDGPSTLRRVSSTGVVTTIAGAAGITGSADGSVSTARFSSPLGLGLDGGGVIYIADTGNDSIRTITGGNVVSTIAGAAPAPSVDASGSSARFNLPNAVAVDSAGNVYVADSANHTIRKITSSGAVSTFAGSAGQSGSSDGIASIAQFSSPSALAIDANGALYIADAGNNTIRKITASGTVSTFAGTAGQRGSTNGTGAAASFDHPMGIAVDSTGAVYVSDSNNHTVRKITPAGAVTTLAGAPDLVGSTDGTGSNARFYFPAALAVDASFNVYVVDQNRVIRKITSAGVVTTLAGSTTTTGSADGTGTLAQFDHPAGLAVDGAGNLFVSDSNNNTIRRITPNGVVSTIGGAAGQIGSADGTGSNALFNHPSGLAVDGAGSLYIADTYNNAIRKGVSANPTAPTITVQPTAQTAVTGGRAVFYVTATNAVSYQWFKDGVPIPGATSATLVISNAQTSNLGSYRVIVTGTGGSVQSTAVALTVTAFSGVRLVNISTRSYVGTGSDVMIAGFIIDGTAPKTVLIRASGPALAQFNLTGLLADPTLEVHRGNTVLASNDNWGDDAASKALITQASLISSAFSWTDGSKDAAVVVTLDPGPYTAIIAGKNNTVGLALAEVYEIDLANADSKLINISTRSLVQTSANVQIAGFIISGTSPKKVVIRASGPALTKYGVPGVLADPMLELHSPTATLATNDDWDVSLRPDFQSVGADNWDVGSKDAAIVTTLDPGSYTAIVSGKNGSSGVSLIEVFAAP